MNARLIFNKFTQLAQSDRDYYIFGQPSQIGIIEDVLAYLGLDYNIKSHPQSMHEEGLNILKSFMLNSATDEQLKLIYEIATKNSMIPEMNPISASSEKVFISMPMDKDKCENVDTIRAGIKSAVEESGNTPYFLDKDTHNDNIYNKMMEEIISCKFLIADLTSQNPGVYYEAGYAKAAGKTVIFTCKEDDFESVHFDIKQTQMVIWNNESTLTEKLFNQIKGSNLSNL